MASGLRLQETGRLERDRDGDLLRPGGGRQWRLDTSLFASWKTRGLVGRRVRVRGSRDAFNVLAVIGIEPAKRSP